MADELNADADFAAKAMAVLPGEAVPAALEARILADFDAVTTRRRRWAVRAQSFADALWPGAPAWQPASILALSLIVGLAAGAFVPAANLTAGTSDPSQAVAFDAAPSLDF